MIRAMRSGWATPTRRRQKLHAAFTLIELLIVILLLAILMAVALPLYLLVAKDSEEKTCRTNMQTIAAAEQAYRTASPAHQYTTILADLAPNLGAAPKCPSGGTYTVRISDGRRRGRKNRKVVPAGGLIIDCSAGGHDRFAPGIDGE